MAFRPTPLATRPAISLVHCISNGVCARLLPNCREYRSRTLKFHSTTILTIRTETRDERAETDDQRDYSVMAGNGQQSAQSSGQPNAAAPSDGGSAGNKAASAGPSQNKYAKKSQAEAAH